MHRPLSHIAKLQLECSAVAMPCSGIPAHSGMKRAVPVTDSSDECQLVIVLDPVLCNSDAVRTKTRASPDASLEHTYLHCPLVKARVHDVDGILA